MPLWQARLGGLKRLFLAIISQWKITFILILSIVIFTFYSDCIEIEKYLDQCQLKSDLTSSVLLSASPPSLRLQMYVTSFSLYYLYFILYSNENFIPHPRQKVCKRTLMRRQFVCRSFPSSPCFAHLPKTFLNSTVTETEPDLG